MVNYRVALARNLNLGLKSAHICSRMESICFWHRIMTADPLRSRLRIMESSFQLNHIDPDAQSSTSFDTANAIDIAAKKSQSLQLRHFSQNTSPVNLLHSAHNTSLGGIYGFLCKPKCYLLFGFRIQNIVGSPFFKSFISAATWGIRRNGRWNSFDQSKFFKILWPDLRIR